MKTLVKNFLVSVSPKEKIPQRSETECLIEEIEVARDQIQYAWNRFNYAVPEYIELALLELLSAETHYSLLLKRYRIMLGESEPPFSLGIHLQNQAFKA